MPLPQFALSSCAGRRISQTATAPPPRQRTAFAPCRHELSRRSAGTRRRDDCARKGRRPPRSPRSPARTPRPFARCCAGRRGRRRRSSARGSRSSNRMSLAFRARSWIDRRCRRRPWRSRPARSTGASSWADHALGSKPNQLDGFRREAVIPNCTTKGRTKRPRGAGCTPSPDQSPIFGLGSAVSFAGDARHSLAVVDRDFPSPIRNQSSLPQRLQRFRHPRSAHAEHER